MGRRKVWSQGRSWRGCVLVGREVGTGIRREKFCCNIQCLSAVLLSAPLLLSFRGINFVLSALVFNIFPTIFEVSLVTGILVSSPPQTLCTSNCCSCHRLSLGLHLISSFRQLCLLILYSITYVAEVFLTILASLRDL